MRLSWYAFGKMFEMPMVKQVGVYGWLWKVLKQAHKLMKKITLLSSFRVDNRERDSRGCDRENRSRDRGRDRDSNRRGRDVIYGGLPCYLHDPTQSISQTTKEDGYNR